MTESSCTERGSPRRRLAVAVGIAAVLAVGFLLFLAFVRREPAAGGLIAVDFGGASQYIDPLLASTPTDSAATRLMFRGLMTTTTTGALTGDLARSWTVTDGGRLYTFRLRSGLRWQNGRPLTSRDVLYTYRLLADPSFPTDQFEWQSARISTPTPSTIVVRLRRADYTFLGQTTVGIVPLDFARSSWPVGDGAFRLATVTSAAIRIVRVGRAPVPGVRGIEFRLGRRPSSMDAVVCRASFRAIPGMVAVPATRLLGLTFNWRRLPVRSLRQALIAALSISPAPRLWSPLPNWTAKQALGRPVLFHDPGRLLRAAGWRFRAGHWFKGTRLLALRLVAPTGSLVTPLLDRVTAAWERDGIQVAVSRLPFPTLVRRVLFPGVWDVVMIEWDFGAVDYDPAGLWSSSAALNFGHVHDGTIDRLLAQLPVTPSASGRDRLRDEIGSRLSAVGAAVGLANEYYVCRIPGIVESHPMPSIVTDAGDLLLRVARWRLKTQIVLANPFS